MAECQTELNKLWRGKLEMVANCVTAQLNLTEVVSKTDNSRLKLHQFYVCSEGKGWL